MNQTQPAAPRGMKTFSIIWLGQLVSILGSGMTSFALGVWIFEQTQQATPFALTVLFGNLPSKKFVSDQDLSVETVRRMTRDLIARMREAGRPFILATECDVLHVPGREAAIRAKIEAMLRT